MTIKEADRALVQAYVEAIEAAIEEGREVHLDCAHCEEEIEYPGDVCLIAGHLVETGEPVINTLHSDCEAPWRADCAEALAKR